MLQSLKSVWLFLAIAVLAAALPAAAAPVLTGISPTSGYPGTQVTLAGTSFGATQGSGSVWLGSKAAGSIVSWSDTQIVAVVASGAGSGSAQVKQGGVWSNSIAFTVITPGITSVSPTSGYPGTQVTLNGTNFGASQGSGSVWLGSKLAGGIVSWSNTQIVATVAATAASGSAQVQQGGVWSNSVAFTVITPSVTSVSPTTAHAGDAITLTGTNFGTTQGSGSVWLGSKLAGSIVSWTSTQIVATVASGATSGNAFVQQGGVWTNSTAFSVVTPTLTSVSPDTARAGDSVTLTGTNFGATQGGGSVWLGSKLAGSIVSWSDTQIVATVASGSITGTAQVQQGGVWNGAIGFTVITPVVAVTVPFDGPVGTNVSIVGNGFGATQGSGLVWIGTQYATVVSWSDEEVVATVAPGSTTGGAQIFQGGVWSNAFNFAVTCMDPRAEPLEHDPADQVWADDEFVEDSQNWGLWDASQSASGAQSFQAGAGEGALGRHWAYVYDDLPPHKLNPGDAFFVDVLIDPCNPPQELKLEFWANVGNDAVRLVWGDVDPLEAGPSAINMGPVPSAGEWHRLQIPFEDMGLVGANLYSVFFEHYDGVVWFDYVGKKTATPAPAHITSLTSSNAGPIHLDDEVTFTTEASGGGTIEYRYRQMEPGTYQSTVVQDWSTSNTFVWTVPYNQQYHFWMWVDVRNAGSTEEYEDLDSIDMRVECISAIASSVEVPASDRIGIDDDVAPSVTMDNVVVSTTQHTLGTSSFTTSSPANYLIPLSFSGLQSELPADPDESLVFFALVDDCGLGQASRIEMYIETAPDAAHPTPVGRWVHWETGYPEEPGWVGDVPTFGAWTRMEVPQSLLDFGFTPAAYGKVSFRSYGPRVWYDAIGTTTSP
jgi:IPT/TIG domain-containing protein